MTPEQFIYWLQGFNECAQQAPTKEQWQIIQDHLKQVFNKQTPLRNLVGPAVAQVFNKTQVVC